MKSVSKTDFFPVLLFLFPLKCAIKQTLEKFLASVPREADYQQQIMSMYLSCSGYTGDKNVCLERVFCEYGNAQSSITEEERDVLSM